MYLITAAEQKPLVSAINIIDHQTIEVLEQMNRVDTDPALVEEQKRYYQTQVSIEQAGLFLGISDN